MTDETATTRGGQGRPVEPGGPPARSWRRRLVVPGIVIGALLLLVVLPGYLAMQPRFFARYPDLSRQYEPWSKSTHVGAACQDCHVPPRRVARATYAARMVGEFYVSLVWRSREPSIFSAPANSACLDCHDDLRSVSPKGDVRIPHRAHIEILKMQCVECHDHLVHEPNAKGEYTPLMANCLRCHDGDKAKDTCTACHTEKATPKTHRVKDWTVVHPVEAAAPGAECADCHQWTEDWCADCHSHRPASHGGDWRAVHGDRVAERRTCEACHEGPFCIRCHGEVPALNFDPSLKLVE